MTQPKFQIGQLVYKWTGDYTGPGIVRGHAINGSGKLRYLVGHRVEGGTGEFLHVYAEGNLKPLDDDLQPVAAEDAEISTHDEITQRMARIDNSLANQLGRSIEYNAKLHERLSQIRLEIEQASKIHPRTVTALGFTLQRLLEICDL
jgi:hypothetical protein